MTSDENQLWVPKGINSISTTELIKKVGRNLEELKPKKDRQEYYESANMQHEC